MKKICIVDVYVFAVNSDLSHSFLPHFLSVIWFLSLALILLVAVIAFDTAGLLEWLCHTCSGCVISLSCNTQAVSL